MRGYAAVWLFFLALAAGSTLYFRKIATDTGETSMIHHAVRKLLPCLQPGQKLSFITDANEGMRLIHARLALAPCNLFLSKATETPDTVLVIGEGFPTPAVRQQYRELAATTAANLNFKILARVR